MQEDEYRQLSLFDEYVESAEIKEFRGWKWKEIKFNLEGIDYDGVKYKDAGSSNTL
jgi:hypothetical protein